MLTRDLLRYQVRDGKLLPRLLKPTPANLALADGLLAHWRAGIGERLGELEEAALPIIHESRSALVGKGLQKLLLDACTFADPASAEELRSRALAASAELLATPAVDAAGHRAAVAARLGLDPAALGEALYADLPHLARLQAAPGWGAEELLERANLALCQGLLLGARSLVVELPGADAGALRRLAKALRWRRLLAEVRRTPALATLVISGPAAVLDQAKSYGLQFALLLPELATTRRWSARAECDGPRREPGPLTLELDQDTGLRAPAGFTGHVPAELAAWLAKLGERLAGRTIDPAPDPLLLPGGELVVPDLAIDGVPIELFHRWHTAALRRRLDQLGRAPLERLVVGVDRTLAKSADAAGCTDHPAFARHGLLFSDLPAAAALAAAVARVQPG